MKLRGNCPAKVDEKGRLKIPAVFLDELKEYGNQFYITSSTGETARIYPMKVWSGNRRQAGAKCRARTGEEKVLMRTSYYGQTVELDGQGKIAAATVYRDRPQTQGRRGRPWKLDYLGSHDHARVLIS